MTWDFQAEETASSGVGIVSRCSIVAMRSRITWPTTLDPLHTTAPAAKKVSVKSAIGRSTRIDAKDISMRAGNVARYFISSLA